MWTGYYFLMQSNNDLSIRSSPGSSTEGGEHHRDEDRLANAPARLHVIYPV